MAALDSVFSLEDLKLFMGFSRAEKSTQLRELVEVVSGIRIFNRDCKKGGEGIHDCEYNI